MLYDYRCEAGHVHELVRPLGTDTVACPACGEMAERSHIHHSHVIGPTVNTLGQRSLFLEGMSEMEYGFKTAEAQTGETIPRPNMLDPIWARAKEKVRRGEVDKKAIRKNYEGAALKNVRL